MTAEQRERIEQIYLELYTSLVTYARVSLGSEALAETAVQETFRIACLKADRFLSSPNPRGWLITTLKGTIQNIQSKKISENKKFVVTNEKAKDINKRKEDKNVWDEQPGELLPL